MNPVEFCRPTGSGILIRCMSSPPFSQQIQNLASTHTIIYAQFAKFRTVKDEGSYETNLLNLIVNALQSLLITINKLTVMLFHSREQRASFETAASVVSTPAPLPTRRGFVSTRLDYQPIL